MIEENNKFDPSAVPLIHDDCLKQKVVGHVPLHLSKFFFRFLKLPDCRTSAMVIGKSANGAGDGLEILVEHRVLGEKITVSWVDIQLKKNEEAINNMENRCVK